MAHVTVASSTKDLLRLVDGPGLLSKHVQIGKYIVDAMIIDAHPEVARWYGYDNPTALQGLYMSQLHALHCFTRVRMYAVARHCGLPGVPEEYDIQAVLPNGARRWLRKQQVRQVTEGGDIYWISHSIPIADAQAREMPAVALPLSVLEIEHYLGRYSVVETERLIENSLLSSASPFNNTTIKETITQPEKAPASPSHVTVPSVELPLGSAQYRRWIHTCNRCQRRWVAEKAAPKKCIHCKSPYWNLPRERRVTGGTTRQTDQPAAH